MLDHSNENGVYATSALVKELLHESWRSSRRKLFCSSFISSPQAFRITHTEEKGDNDDGRASDDEMETRTDDMVFRAIEETVTALEKQKQEHLKKPHQNP